MSLQKVPCKYDTTLRGKVWRNFRPQPTATVKVFDMHNRPVEHTITDANGKYIFKNTLPPGDYLVVATAPDHMASKPSRITLSNGKKQYKLLMIPKSVELNNPVIYGTVRDKKGKPVPYAKLLIRKQGKLKSTQNKSITNSKGDYLVYGLQPGTYQIRIVKKGFQQPEKTVIKLFEHDRVNLDFIIYQLPTNPK